MSDQPGNSTFTALTNTVYDARVMLALAASGNLPASFVVKRGYADLSTKVAGSYPVVDENQNQIQIPFNSQLIYCSCYSNSMSGESTTNMYPGLNTTAGADADVPDVPLGLSSNFATTSGNSNVLDYVPLASDVKYGLVAVPTFSIGGIYVTASTTVNGSTVTYGGTAAGNVPYIAPTGSSGTNAQFVIVDTSPYLVLYTSAAITTAYVDVVVMYIQLDYGDLSVTGTLIPAYPSETAV